MRIKVAVLTALMSAGFALTAWGTTWSPEEITCPLCGEANRFQVIRSYGSYIYRWPTRIEYVFWPYTESEFLYSCQKCKLTLFAEDFGSLPRSKKSVLKSTLKGAAFDQEYKDYTAIPMKQKIALAEKLYTALGKDDEFWCLFYRVKGFHLWQAKRTEEAKVARLRAIEFAAKLIADPSRKPILKEAYAISGAMYFWCGEAEKARAAFDASLPLEYTFMAVFDEAAIRRQAKASGEKISKEEMDEYRLEFEEEAKATVDEMNEYLNDYAKEFLQLLDTPEAKAFLKGEAYPQAAAPKGETDASSR